MLVTSRGGYETPITRRVHAIEFLHTRHMALWLQHTKTRAHDRREPPMAQNAPTGITQPPLAVQIRTLAATRAAPINTPWTRSTRSSARVALQPRCGAVVFFCVVCECARLHMTRRRASDQKTSPRSATATSQQHRAHHALCRSARRRRQRRCIPAARCHSAAAAATQTHARVSQKASERRHARARGRRSNDE